MFPHAYVIRGACGKAAAVNGQKNKTKQNIKDIQRTMKREKKKQQ